VYYDNKFINLLSIMNSKGTCPICDAEVTVKEPEVSEVVSCPDCGTSLVISSIDDSTVLFEEAPAVEEDWGE